MDGVNVVTRDVFVDDGHRRDEEHDLGAQCKEAVQAGDSSKIFEGI